jgi:hypothetical protein
VRSVEDAVVRGEQPLEEGADDLLLVPEVVVEVARADRGGGGDVVGGDGRRAPPTSIAVLEQVLSTASLEQLL